MAQLARDDGVEIHWEEQGSGPLVVLAPYCISHPSVFERLGAISPRITAWSATTTAAPASRRAGGRTT